MNITEEELRHLFHLRITKGVALLDAKMPTWPHEIDTDHLDMENPYRCVLGQLAGDYTKGRQWLDIPMGFHHGFSTEEWEVDEDFLDPWRVLTEMWIDCIHNRRSVTGAAA